MTQNFTESLASWPWAAWLILAFACAAVELYRRDDWGWAAMVGCIVAAAAALLTRAQFGWHFLAFALGTAVALVLQRPWRTTTDPDA